MLDWMSKNAEALNLLVNLDMLLVCLVYLHVFLFSYLNQSETEAPRDAPLEQLTRQRPLLSGHYMDVNSYGNILDRLRDHEDAPALGDPQDAELEIIVVARHGSDDPVIAARRRFRLERRPRGVRKPCEKVKMRKFYQ